MREHTESSHLESKPWRKKKNQTLQKELVGERKRTVVSTRLSIYTCSEPGPSTDSTNMGAGKVKTEMKRRTFCKDCSSAIFLQDYEDTTNGSSKKKSPAVPLQFSNLLLQRPLTPNQGTGYTYQSDKFIPQSHLIIFQVFRNNSQTMMRWYTELRVMVWTQGPGGAEIWV